MLTTIVLYLKELNGKCWTQGVFIFSDTYYNVSNLFWIIYIWHNKLADSPRSDIDDSPSPELHSRPDSSKAPGSRPSSSRTGSSLPTTRTPPSRPPSHRQTQGSRSKSAPWEPQPHVQSLRSLPKSSEAIRRLPEEVTMHVPDHINPKGL